MKKITLMAAALLFSTLTLSADSNGGEIFEVKCSACHILQPPGATARPGTPEFEKAMNALKAPPMAKVSSMIKMHYDTKEAYVKFVKEYITKPDADKTAVAEWIYDNVHAGKKIGEMKYSPGKCGGGMGQGKVMKYSPGKCGGK